MSLPRGTPAGRKSRAAIYREAARFMESENGSHRTSYPCWCIAHIEGEEDLSYWRDAPSVLPFLTAFSAKEHISQMSDEYLDNMHIDYQLERDYDILALCFMAAMVEAGDA